MLGPRFKGNLSQPRGSPLPARSPIIKLANNKRNISISPHHVEWIILTKSPADPFQEPSKAYKNFPVAEVKLSNSLCVSMTSPFLLTSNDTAEYSSRFCAIERSAADRVTPGMSPTWSYRKHYRYAKMPTRIRITQALIRTKESLLTSQWRQQFWNCHVVTFLIPRFQICVTHLKLCFCRRGKFLLWCIHKSQSIFHCSALIRDFLTTRRSVP